MAELSITYRKWSLTSNVKTYRVFNNKEREGKRHFIYAIIVYRKRTKLVVYLNSTNKLVLVFYTFYVNLAISTTFKSSKFHEYLITTKSTGSKTLLCSILNIVTIIQLNQYQPIICWVMKCTALNRLVWLIRVLLFVQTQLKVIRQLITK